MVIADTDFLSSFVKIGRLQLIFEAFGISRITITRAVLHELERAPFFSEVLALIDSDRIGVKAAETAASEEFGAGELESIALAEQTGELLLMSDRAAIAYAEQQYILIFDIATFLLYCKRKGVVSNDDVTEIIRQLKEKDRYEFSDDVKRLLLQ